MNMWLGPIFCKSAQIWREPYRIIHAISQDDNKRRGTAFPARLIMRLPKTQISLRFESVFVSVFLKPASKLCVYGLLRGEPVCLYVHKQSGQERCYFPTLFDISTHISLF